MEKFTHNNPFGAYTLTSRLRNASDFYSFSFRLTPIHQTQNTHNPFPAPITVYKRKNSQLAQRERAGAVREKPTFETARGF